MLKKLIIPLVFVLVGSSFVTYSFLDTFVIEKQYDVEYEADANVAVSQFSFSFAEMPIEPEEPSEPEDSSILDNSEIINQENNENENNSHQSEESSIGINQDGSSSSQASSQESSSVVSSSSEPSSSSFPDVNISTNQYYENLTTAQIKSLFTKEKVFIPKKHYSDPDIYIDISSGRFEDFNTYYAADIRIRSMTSLKTALALGSDGKPGENINEKTSVICNRHKGIIAIDGDTYGSQKNGYVIRNGQPIRSEPNLSRRKPEDLAIYSDGTFEIFSERDYTLEQIRAKGAWQVFSFGPGLIKDGGKIIGKGEEVGIAANGYMNQRCAIGMISPLHYVFMVSDGRIRESPGLSLYQVGKVMESLHCYCAYNLDGGGSATMYFDDGTGNANGQGALINYCTQQLVGNNSASTLPIAPPIEEREVSDIVYIGKE